MPCHRHAHFICEHQRHRGSTIPLSYDANGNQTSTVAGLEVGALGYTSFGLPTLIRNSQGDEVKALKYDAEGQRAYKITHPPGGGAEETFYVDGLYEMRRDANGVKTHVFYIPGTDRIVAQETWTETPAIVGSP